MGLATSEIFCAIVFSCSRLSGSSSLFLRMVSSITMAPSTIIPKSIAPKESKLAGIWVKCMSINAINKDNGIVMATRSAPRQLPRKMMRTKITRIIPSKRVLETVCSVLSTKLVLSSTTCIFTPSGRIFSFSSSTVAFTPAKTAEGFSFFNRSTIPSMLSE